MAVYKQEMTVDEHCSRGWSKSHPILLRENQCPPSMKMHQDSVVRCLTMSEGMDWAGRALVSGGEEEDGMGMMVRRRPCWVQMSTCPLRNYEQ